MSSGTWDLAAHDDESALDCIKASLANLGIFQEPNLSKPRLQETPERPDIVCQLLLLQDAAFSRNVSGNQLQEVTQLLTPRMHGLLAYVGSLLKVRLSMPRYQSVQFVSVAQSSTNKVNNVPSYLCAALLSVQLKMDFTNLTAR